MQNYDAHPIDNGVLIHVTGGLKMDNENDFFFSQTFILVSNGNNGYHVKNDIFRLIY